MSRYPEFLLSAMTNPGRPKSRINGMLVHVPRALEGVAPVSPNDADFPYEPCVWAALDSVSRADTIAYDCGMAWGLISALMAQRVTAGEVHAFEANAGIIPAARELFETNGASVVVNEVCIGEQSGVDAIFHVAPGNHAVASSRHPAVPASHPDAREVTVPVIALDDYARERGHAPGVLKIDIEGSEVTALRGAAAILAMRPHLVIETHPAQLVGEGASLAGLCASLEAMGYPLFDLNRGELTNGAAFAEANPFLPGQLMASMDLRDPAFLTMLQQRLADAASRYADRSRHQEAIRRARELLDSDAQDAIGVLQGVVAASPRHAEAHYLLGFAMHAAAPSADRAMHHYQTALALGFDAFWVHYNLGALFFNAGDRDRAREHIFQALRLNSEHEGARHYWTQLSA